MVDAVENVWADDWHRYVNLAGPCHFITKDGVWIINPCKRTLCRTEWNATIWRNPKFKLYLKIGKKKHDMMTSCKRVRICGHLVTFTLVNSCSKWTSDLNLLVFEHSTYFRHIVQFLPLFENLTLRYLSKYHDEFYNSSNGTSKLFK